MFFEGHEVIVLVLATWVCGSLALDTVPILSQELLKHVFHGIFPLFISTRRSMLPCSGAFEEPRSTGPMWVKSTATFESGPPKRAGGFDQNVT